MQNKISSYLVSVRQLLNADPSPPSGKNCLWKIKKWAKIWTLLNPTARWRRFKNRLLTLTLPLFLSFLGLNELFRPFINLILKSVIPGKEWMKLLRCVSVVHRNRGYSRFLYKIYSCSINNNTKGPFQIWLCNSSWPEICQIIKNTWIIIAKFLCFQEIQYFTLHNKRTKWNHHNLHH